MNVATIIGTRPDIIKMSEIIRKFDKHFNHTLIHTNQNFSPQLSDVFFSDLRLRKPDWNLGIAGNSLGETISSVIYESERVLKKERPDAVVILGDTNSSLAGIMAKRLKIPLFHLEAGNRSFNEHVPEEINRRIIDHISDINLVYTEHARRNLLAEGIASQRIFTMGSPMFEVLSAQKTRIQKSSVLADLGIKTKKFYLVSIHRDENTNVENLKYILFNLNSLAEATKSTVVMSCHPRLRLDESHFNPNILVHEPFGFLDYCKLQTSAKCVISDSGTIAEESAILGFPAVTIRNAMERPEAVDVGSLIHIQPNQNLIEAVSMAEPPKEIPEAYRVENCSERVLRAVLGYTGYVNRYVWNK